MKTPWVKWLRRAGVEVRVEKDGDTLRLDVDSAVAADLLESAGFRREGALSVSAHRSQLV